MDMDMSPSAGTSTMTSFLHFAGGDMLLFHSLHPSSPGALAGAALVLFLIAVFERWLAAFRGAMDARWRERAIAVVTDHSARHSPSLSDSVQCHKDAPPSVTNDPLSSQSPNPATPRRSPRTIAPFLLAVDVPRGVLHAAQTLLRYIIMLAIMTFQAAYLIALVAGAGVGELLFGRYGGYKAGDH